MKNQYIEGFPKTSELMMKIAKKENVTEEDLRQCVNFDIQNFVKENYDVNFSFSNEQIVELNGTIGRIDSTFGSLIIEYKKPTLKLEDKQRQQLLNYLTFGKKQNKWGILTNGIEIEVYQYSDEEKGFRQNSSFSGKLSRYQLEYVCRIIAKKDNIVLNSNNINDYLGIEKHKKIIKNIYTKLSYNTNSRTNLLYDEWQKLFNLSAEKDFSNNENRKTIRRFYSNLIGAKIETTNNEYKMLFSIQTYYSIMLKLLLVKLISDKRGKKFPKHQYIKEFFESIENNNIYREMNISNLVDGDFFSWYLDEFTTDDFIYFYDAIEPISSVESEDLNLMMIHFYENVFPFQVRHAMGEFYTPFELANKVVNQAGNFFLSQNGRKPSTILDPCCGSGIFVLNALKISNHVFGIDINPIAVLTAKINYLLNTSLIPENMLEIPIYLGDSTYFPIKEYVNGVLCYTYDLITSVPDNTWISFAFPIEVINLKNYFEILDYLEGYISRLDKDGAINLVASYSEFHYSELSERYNCFIDTLILLEQKQLNSIWLKIIGNYLKAGSITDQDLVVGNPPWVRWGNLPDNYRKKIKEKCKIDGVFSKDRTHGGVDLNIAALLCHISIRDRLNRSGILGFLMPDSVLFNKSYEGFRNFLLNEKDKYHLIFAERWNKTNEKPFSPVTLEFAEYYFSVTTKLSTEIFDRKDNVRKIAFKNPSSFNNHYIISSPEEEKEILSVLGKNSLVFRSGVSLIKGGHYLLKFINTVTKSTSIFQTYELVNKRFQLSSNYVELENEIIYPFVNAPMIVDDVIEVTDMYCVFPYPANSKVPYSLNEIRTRFPKFHGYFMRDTIQEAINSSSKYNSRIQKNKFDVGIFRVGDYTYAKHFLVCRDNTKSSFAKIDWIKVPWGEKKNPIFDGHVSYIDNIEYEKKYGEKFTPEIRDRLFNIFIKKGVKLYVKNSSDSRSISSRLYNDIKI